MNRHDKTLKDLFDERDLVASVVRTFHEQLGLSPEVLARLDFDTIEEIPTDFTISGRRARIADRARRIRLRAAPGEESRWIYPLFEFQGRSDAHMYSRMMEYERYCNLRYGNSRKGCCCRGGSRGSSGPILSQTHSHKGETEWT